ncbi:MAG: hypothetical protein V4628_16890 [Pseudomonadota bacterium]
MKSIRATLDSLSIKELSNLVRSVYAASAHRDILAGINTSLVLFGQILINTASGEYRQLAEAEEGKTQAELIAASARQLLAGREDSASILLLLPPADFIATRFTMGITGEKLLRSALMLQVHTLVPAYEEPLLLGLNGGSADGVALWYPARNAELLFTAFKEQGLFLATLMPRSLALLQTSSGSEDYLLIDEDALHVTQLECRDGIIKSLLSINQIDLQQEEFAAQWNTECSKAAAATKIRSSDQESWTTLRQVFQPIESYSFLPAGADQVGRDLIAKKQKKLGGIAAIAVVALLCLPFLSNWIRMAMLESQVNSLRDESTEARRSQAAVYEMDEEWGAILEYPRQDVDQILLSLNELIENSLSSFQIDKGVIDIVGFAQDPAVLIEQLAEREEFYDVGQSRSSSSGNSELMGDRFGIRMSVSEVDYPGYEAKYPVAEQ